MKPLLILISLMLGLPALGQSTWRNFFTTNQSPIVDVVAGSNATVQASLIGVNQRRFTVNAVPTAGGQTNWPWQSITNINTVQIPYESITNQPATVTNKVYATNVVSGGQLNLNTLASNTASSDKVLISTSVNSSKWDNSLTDINIGTLTVTNPPYLNLVNSTNLQTTIYTTNQGSLTLAMTGPETWFAFNTNADFTISGISGVSTFGTNVQKFTMIVTNTSGSTKVMALPAGWIKHDGVNCYITNQGILTGVVYPGMGTNAAFKCLK